MISDKLIRAGNDDDEDNDQMNSYDYVDALNIHSSSDIEIHLSVNRYI